MSKIWKYNSVAAFAADIENRPTLPAWEVEISRAESDDRTEFTGTKTFAEALHLLKNGDTESAKKITACMAADGIKGKRTVTQFAPAVTGCLPHVPNFVRSVPKSMLAVNRRVVNAPTKIITLYIETAVCGLTSASRIIEAGAKIASVVVGLERAGYRVNLFANISVQNPKNLDDVYCVSVKIKDAAAPLNVLNITFALVNPSFLRRCFFRFMETHVSNYITGYGIASVDTEKIKDITSNGFLIRLKDVIEKGSAVSDIITSLQR